ncbi:hypothetical protein DOT_0134 [Desulfosporosinus sp. OT]|nr:hypothetical protein DOT_0134 [Desulfosporosinus sp. OT]
MLALVKADAPVTCVGHGWRSVPVAMTQTGRLRLECCQR